MRVRLLALLTRIAAPFRPEPGTPEGAVMLGLLLLGVGLGIGLPPLALWGPGAGLAVPGLLMIAISLGLTFERRAD